MLLYLALVLFYIDISMPLFYTGCPFFGMDSLIQNKHKMIVIKYWNLFENDLQFVSIHNTCENIDKTTCVFRTY